MTADSHADAGTSTNPSRHSPGPEFDVIDTALDLIPVASLGIMPRALFTVVEKIKAAEMFATTQDAFFAMIQRLAAAIAETRTSVQDVIDRYKDKDLDPETFAEAADIIQRTMEMREAFDVVTGTITELVSRAEALKPPTTHRALRSAKRILYKARNRNMVESMRIMLGAAIDSFQLHSRIAVYKAIEVIGDLLQKAEYRRVIAQLPYVDAGYRAEESVNSDFTDGTLDDLFRGLHLWSTGSFPRRDPKRVYLLIPPAGTDTSAVSHRLSKHLANGEFRSKSCTSLLGASFFVRGKGEKASARLVAPTVARQLAGCHSSLLACIASAAQARRAQGNVSETDYTLEELLKYCTADMPFRNPDTRLVLVLDGLDAHTEQLLMFEALMHLIILVRKLPWLYVFATSRLEPKMIQAFASPAATGHVHWQEFGDPSRSSNNAGLYLQSTLPRIHGYANLVKSDTSLLPRLISRAGDSLIFARIAVKFLDTQRNNAEKALKIILSEEEPAQSPLDSLYLQILQYTFPPNQLAALPQQHARLVSLLIIVALAGRPLPPATIAHLSLPLRKNIALHNTELDSADVDEVAQDPSETYKVIEMVSLLQPVLSFDNRGNVIPVHASLVQFLLDRSRCGNSLYHVNKDEGNTSFAHACLDAISSVETATGILIAHRTQEQALRIYGHYALLRLDGHLMDATWTDWLGSLLAAIVGGIQLPIMARIIITDSNPGTIIGWQYEGLKSFHQKNDLAANIGDDSERSAKAPIAEEYVKFMAYCCCVMDYIREHPEDDWPKFTGETVQIFFVEFLRQQGEEALADAASKWSADQLHVDRYWGVLSVLKAEIDQSDRARSIWYDFSVRGGNFFV